MNTNQKIQRAVSLIVGAVAAGGVLLALPAVSATPEGDSIFEGFVAPPNSARPRVWWHWMNGNVTQQGIDLDLAWMKRVGIGGLQNFDANLATPQVVEQRLAYMTPEWKSAFKHTVQLADQLGLELTIASSPGWSETGGPWVEPRNAMKKFVWSETDVEGGRHFSGVLKAPPGVTGPYQALPAVASAFDAASSGAPLPTYYADSAVVAYPIWSVQKVAAPAVTTSAGNIAAEKLLDRDLSTSIDIPESDDHTAWVRYDLHAPRTIRSAVLGSGSVSSPLGGSGVDARLEASADGVTFHKVADLANGLAPEQTTSFAPVTARYFRLVLGRKQLAGFDIVSAAAPGADFGAIAALMGGAGGPQGATKPPAFSVASFELSSEERVQDAEVKAGFALTPDFYALERADRASEHGPAAAQVIDLTSQMRADGRLEWTPPKGHWRIVRLGYSLTGTENHPASAEATGLEVDKLNRAAVRSYIETYLDTYKSFLGSDLMGQHGVRALLNDSTEVGAQNWTDDMLKEFKARRGYDPAPWLPVLTGAVIGDGVKSDAFLYDFRKTIAELHAEYHYGTIAAVAHERGLLNYGEALEDRRPVFGDDLDMRRYTSIPMAAMWTYNRKVGAKPTYKADIRGAASVAHLYGQNLVAAESMTAAMAPWAFTPRDLKTIIDLEFDLGVNRPVIHTSVHQPLVDKKPGLSLSIFGQYFNRNETWAEFAGPWVDYLARNSYMLQQGRFFADVAYFGGEEAPFTGLYGEKDMTNAPVHYAFDFVNPELLLHHLDVQDGALTASTGASFKLLFLGGSSQRMSLRMLRRVHEFVAAGLSVAGQRPVSSPVLGDDAAEFRQLADDLWAPGQHAIRYGKGTMYAVDQPEDALKLMGVTADFDAGASASDADVRFVHRRLSDGDSYFVNNRLDRAENLQARFRVVGKVPELWHPETGTREAVSWHAEGAVTVVELRLVPDDAVHVVFRTPTVATSGQAPAQTQTTLGEITGSWNLSFESGRGAPASVTLPDLTSWADSADAGIKYFSGVGTYSHDFALSAADLQDGRVVLDMGRVRDLAEVWVNGRRVGEVWHAPYRIDVTDAARPGQNQLEIRVVNPWVNRLIGDAQPGATRYTFTVVPTYMASAPLRESGLLGPVTLMKMR